MTARHGLRWTIMGVGAVVLLAATLRVLGDEPSTDTHVIEPAPAHKAGMAASRTPPRHAAGLERENLDDDDWDRLSPEDRIARATAQFDRAMRELEIDRSDAAAREQARRALASLRPELSIDRSGSQRYREIERRFEALAE